jgi:hypothetical protein
MRELFYLAPAGKLMTVSIRNGATLEFGTAQVLMELRAFPSRQSTDRQQYATADGRRFLVNEVIATERPGLIAVLNWNEGIAKAGQ